MPIDAVLFDLDETLHARSRSLAVFARRIHAGAPPGIAAQTSEERFVETVLRGDERGRRPQEGLFTWLVNRFELGLTATEIVEIYRAWEQPVLFGDAQETLRRLRPCKLGIVTNGSERSQGAKIVNSGLDQLTDEVAISGVLGVRKPEPEIFEDICRRLDVAPSRCVMVGDSPEHDVGGGRAAGMRTIWIERAPWPVGLARDYDASVTGLSEIVPVVDRWAHE